MNATLLAIVLWASASAGVVTVILAIRRPAIRRPLLVTAAVLFLPIGVLGILSVGALFLAAAVACLVVALVHHPATPQGQGPD